MIRSDVLAGSLEKSTIVSHPLGGDHAEKEKRGTGRTNHQKP